MRRKRGTQPTTIQWCTMSSAPAPSPVPAPSRPPNQPIAPASSNNSQPRVRTQGGRKKAAPLIEPDALYRAEPASAHLAGSKRTAQEKPEGEPRKRKRVEHTSVFHAQQHAVANAPSPAVSATSANASSAKQQQQAVASNASNNRQQVIGPDTENQTSLVRYTEICLHCRSNCGIRIMISLCRWISRRCPHRHFTNTSFITTSYQPSIQRLSALMIRHRQLRYWIRPAWLREHRRLLRLFLCSQLPTVRGGARTQVADGALG